MEPDYEQAQSKKLEVNQVLRTSLIKVGIEPDATDELITATLNPAIAVRAPKKCVSDEKLKANPEQPVKPGNIKLSINTLIEHIEKVNHLVLTQSTSLGLVYMPLLSCYV